MTQTKKFKVFWDEVYCFEALVEAKDLKDAIEQVKSDATLFCNINQAEYIEDSFDVNYELKKGMI